MSVDEHGPVWSQVARARGLSLEATPAGATVPGRLRGFIDGYGVELRAAHGKAVSQTLPGVGGASTIEARCTMPPPLATGLVVETAPPQGQLSGLQRFELGDRDDVQIGDARLDAALVIRGEPAHILPLFTPELRALLHTLLDGGYQVTLLDTGVALRRAVDLSDAAKLDDALRASVEATLLPITRARRATWPPSASPAISAVG